MKTKTNTIVLIFFMLTACTQPEQSTSTPEIISTSTAYATDIPEITSEPTSEAGSEFNIVEAQLIKADDITFSEYLRPGINVKVVLENLDTGWLPIEELDPSYFCSPCNGWDNAGQEGEYNVVILHYYSFDLEPGENTISITANEITRSTMISWDSSMTEYFVNDNGIIQENFEIVTAELLKNNDSNYGKFLRPGINIKVILKDLDPGLLPEDQLSPENFCTPCSGWDNAGMNDTYYFVVLHYYSFDLRPGENQIRVNAYGTSREATIYWDSSLQDTLVGSVSEPQANFEILQAEIVRADDTSYAKVLRPGINVKVVLGDLDTGLLPEDQLRPQYFCFTCNGWDNVGFKNGSTTVILHYARLSAGQITIQIRAYDVIKEVVLEVDPEIHLVK